MADELIIQLFKIYVEFNEKEIKFKSIEELINKYLKFNREFLKSYKSLLKNYDSGPVIA